MATNKSEVTLLIDDQSFQVKKELLCEHSDYFRAMFSGNYIEEDKNEISIGADVIDANTMNIILRYMELGLIDLNEYPLSAIEEIALAAIFLQIPELLKQIEYFLELNLSSHNWTETMTIAENTSLRKLEEGCATFSLYKFKHLKPEHIEPVQKLVWLLSHKYLNADSELDVFKFGMDWMLQKEAGADVLLLILGCLDMTRVTKDDLRNMKDLIKDYVNSLAEKVIDCLHKLATDFELSEAGLKTNKTVLCEMYTESVYTEVLNLVSDSSKRELKLIPCVHLSSKGYANDMKKQDKAGMRIASNYLYKFNEDSGFTKWLEVVDKNMWGWNVIAWGPTKLVFVCGEHGRGTGHFFKNLKVYDVLKNEWTEHNANLPPRRHGGAGILDNSLYIVGGVGGYRVMLDSVIIYDLVAQTWRKVCRFPESIQSPAVCIHEGKVYGAGHKMIYQYEDNEGDQGDSSWLETLRTEIRIGGMVSYKGYIYCTQNYFTMFYKFKPGVDERLQAITSFTAPPATLCHLGDHLMAFISSNETQGDTISVEVFSHRQSQTVEVWLQRNCLFAVNDATGNCAILDSKPPVKNNISSYVKRQLMNFESCHHN